MISTHEPDLGALKEELARRQARRQERRYRRRWLRRWRRRRLLLRLLVLERDLAEEPDDAMLALHRAEAARIAHELTRNARRLFQ